MKNSLRALIPAFGLISGVTAAQDDIDALVERGQELYDAQVGCWVCHGETGEGLVGPTLLNGPTPAEILDQLETNPMMGVIVQEMNPTDDDLVALSFYIRQLADLPLDTDLPDEYRTTLAAVRASRPDKVEFPKTERDIVIESIQSYGSVLTDWERRANTGSLMRSFDTELLASFDAGDAKFEPQPGHTYFYENIGTGANRGVLSPGTEFAESSQIVLGDAHTKEVIASYELPVELRSAVHTTVLSPDGRYVYIVGSASAFEDRLPNVTTFGMGASATGLLTSRATLIKADALTLQPIKQMTIGGRLHHGQVFRDRYLLLDMFSTDPTGLNMMLFDPETDTVLGGMRSEDLGGIPYTSWTDDEYIYTLMEPGGYTSGYVAAINLYQGRYVTMKPFWVAKIDPDTWEVVREYPYPGYRANWIVFDDAGENMYVIAGGSSSLAKINLETGAVDWAGATGISSYGASLNADETEIWTADKGESTGHYGRTITVRNANSGQMLATLFSGYQVDHVLLAPNGREMWATSNAEGRIYVFDTATREQSHVIDMPYHGDPHGLVWVHYDDDGDARVVRDQGGFHNGINPAAGDVLSY
jgi:DNA-binding beta-propeller fold protein YncE/mono/diheme cytochrome c family protein